MIAQKKSSISKVEHIPALETVSDLVQLSKSRKFYHNVDMHMLWNISECLEELDSMIGMEKLKETLFVQILYYLQKLHKRNRNEEYLHILILGPPGSGKTTVAKIIGNLYVKMGILSDTGTFKIAYRDDFIAEYLGQTAIKTKKLLKSCIGGVLFIDEIYALGPGKNDRDSFSKEAIDTLTGFLSEHKNDFCCIAAGYEEDIKASFLSINKGLMRRFPWVHRIDPYSSKELATIFSKIVYEAKWTLTMKKDDLHEIIETNKDFFIHSGGDMEVLLSKSKMCHAKRVFGKSLKYRYKLDKNDITGALQMMRRDRENVVEDKTSYDMMYI